MNQSYNSLPNGVYAASLTPLTNKSEIDTYKMLAHCKWLLNNGCNGLVLFGTTGEANSFSVNERISGLEKLIEGGLSPEKLMIGTGSCAEKDAIELTEHAVEFGVGGVLILPPFYYKEVSDEGLFRYYAEIIEKTKSDKLRIYLYHIPQVSGVPLSLSLIAKLVEYFPKNIVGIKDSSGDWGNTAAMLKAFPGFRVFAGSEKYLLDTLRMGGPGCISASTNIVCNLTGELYEKRSDVNVEAIQKKLVEIRLDLEKFPMIAALKYIKSVAAGDGSWNNIRPPLVALSEEQQKAVDGIIRKYDLI